MMADVGANPIFLREMREAMRAEAKSDPWRIRLLALVAFSAALLYGSAAAGLYHVSAPVIAFYVLALAESIYVMRPVDPTTIVAREKQQNTFEPLLLTPLSPGRFLKGHLLYHLTAALRRAAVMLPLFGAVYILGGFSLGQFAAYQLLLLVYLLAVNSTLMAVANAQPALSEGAAAAMASRKGGRRQGAAANLNPVALLAYFLLPLILLGGNLAVRGSLLQALSIAGTPAAPPVWDLVKCFALVHPFLTLLVWGDAMVFGRAVPVWIVAALFWAGVTQVSAFTFIHQVMLRKFRPDKGYRAGRWILFTMTLGILCALAWRVPHLGVAACAALTIFYLALRFANPMGVPLRERETWQLLARRDLFVHRAGNLFPFLIALFLPACAVQALLVGQANLPGLGLAAAYINGEAFLTVAALLLGGQILRMRRIVQGRDGASGPEKPAAAVADGQGGEIPGAPGATGKTAAAPANPVAGIAIAVWLFPLALLALEPLLRPTPAGRLVSAAARLTEPLLLINPLRFGYLLVSRNAEALLLKRPLDVAVPPAPGAVELGLPLGYYEASLAAGAVVVAVLMVLFALGSRRLARQKRSLSDHAS